MRTPREPVRQTSTARTTPRRARAALLAALWVAGGHGVAADAPAAGCLAIPRLNAAPIIDGALEPREWACAALLPPPARIADGVIDIGSGNLRVFVGWKDDSVLVGISRPNPVGAFGLAPARNQVAIEFTRPGREPVRFSLGPGPVTPPAVAGWNCRTRVTDNGWEAEAQLPYALIGAADTACALTVTPSGPAGGPPTHRLTQNIRFTALPLACRFIAMGPFPSGQTQGAEIELVNDGTEAVSCRVELALRRGTQEAVRVDETAVVLPPDSSQRYRVVAPLATGQCPLSYTVMRGDACLTRGEIAFDSSGPIQVEVVPFFLTGGLLVRMDVPAGTNLSVRARLTDAADGRPLSATSGRTDQAGHAEVFLSTKDVPPGPYQVQVEAGR